MIEAMGCATRHGRPLAAGLWLVLTVVVPALTVLAEPEEAGTGGEYKVYAAPVESPHHTTPAPPADGRTTVVAPADPLASPFGWHDTDGAPGPEHTTLEGNNAGVQASVSLEGLLNPPVPAPDCGPMLVCDFPLDLTQAPASYSAASQTNLFYWLNLFHDVTFRHGFTSAAGNFQLSDYGGGGVGGDRIEGRLRYDVNCGTTVSVPPDGSSAQVILSPCTFGGETRDAALDTHAILHLIGHGLSQRLVGGPANTSCLGNLQSPLEGWSDFLGLLFTIEPGDAGTDPRPFGTWLAGQPVDGPGLRAQPYSTDSAINDWTYETIFGSNDRFAIGAVWAQALWRATWALIDVHGFGPDLGDAEGGAGNQRMLSYVIDGLGLTPCNPSFLDARDALLTAAALADPDDVCPLWTAFAMMGLGSDAVSVTPSSTQVSNGFALPPECAPRTSIFSDGFEAGGCGGWTAVFPGC